MIRHFIRDHIDINGFACLLINWVISADCVRVTRWRLPRRVSNDVSRVLLLRTSRIPRWDTRAICLINVVQVSQDRRSLGESEAWEQRSIQAISDWIGLGCSLLSVRERFQGTDVLLHMAGYRSRQSVGRVSNSVNSVCITHFSSISMGLVHSVAYASLAPNREQHYEADFYTLRWNEALAVI